MKNKTGIKLSKEEYRKATFCVRCGMYGSRTCPSCKQYKKCKICSRVLRFSWNSYSYEGNRKMFADYYTEYTTVRHSLFAPFNDKMCAGCVDWKKDVKDECFLCKESFENSEKDYLANGNCCGNCILKITLKDEYDRLYDEDGKIKVEGWGDMVVGQKSYPHNNLEGVEGEDIIKE